MNPAVPKTRTTECTLQVEPFLTVHMLCTEKNRVMKDKAKRDKRGSARRGVRSAESRKKDKKNKKRNKRI